MFIQTVGPLACCGWPSAQVSACAALAPSAAVAPANPAAFRKVLRFWFMVFPRSRVLRPVCAAISVADPAIKKSVPARLCCIAKDSIGPFSGLRVAEKAQIMPCALCATGGVSHGCRNVRGNVRMVLESLVATHLGPDRHDGDLVAAICVDAVYRSAQSETRNDAR